MMYRGPFARPLSSDLAPRAGKQESVGLNFVQRYSMEDILREVIEAERGRVKLNTKVVTQ